MIGIITADGMLKYNFDAMVYKQGSEEALNKMQYLLKAFDTAVSGLIESNRWAK